jgi:acetyl esterase/lipase
MHMPSAEHEQYVALLSAQPPAGQGTIEEMRAGMEAAMVDVALDDDVTVERLEVAGCAAEWITTPASDSGRTVLYLHGGGYVMGSINTHRELVSRIARAAAARVLNLDYRLAPENPFPASVQDATGAYEWLLGQGVRAERIVVAGDSAGGGLTLATLLALKAQGSVLPAGGVCLSPWTDLEGTGNSCQPGVVDDPMVGVDELRGMGLHYAADDLRNPLAAPLYGDYAGLPPLLIQVGTRELLLDDARRVAEKARNAGVEVTLEAEEGLVHVWQAMPGLPESAEAVARIGGFIKERLP